MIIIFIILLFCFSIYETNSQNYKLCEECSQNIGSGFVFSKPEISKGDYQLVSSAVGITSSELIKIKDGTTLISGYMPICVLPIIGFGFNDTSICSNKEYILNSNAYLIDGIIWNIEPSNLNYVKEGIFQEKIKIKQEVNEIKNFNIDVFAVKGGIKSKNENLEISIYPNLKPILSSNFKTGENIVCNNKDIIIEIKDSYYSDKEFEVIWDDNDTSKTRVINIKEQSVNRAINLKIKNKEGLCDSTIFLSFKPVRPEASVQILPKNGILELNPSDYENLDEKFYYKVKLNNTNSDFIQALNICPPMRITADVNIPKKLLVPIGENFRKLSEENSYIKLEYQNNFTAFDTNNELFTINALPIIVDEENGTIEISNILFVDNEGNNEIYKIQGTNLNISVKACKIDNNTRFLKNYFNSLVNIFYPNPTDRYLNIKFNRSNIQSKFISIKLYDYFGNEFDNIVLSINDFDDLFILDLPLYLSSGNYKIVISDGFTIEHINFIINK